MKIKQTFIGGLVILAMLALGMATAVAAPPDPINYFSVASTNNGVGTSWAIVSARSASGGAPRVTYLTAGSDTNSAGFGVLLFYKVLSQAVVNYTNSTTTLNVVSTNTGGGPTWQSGSCVIRHVLNDTYEKRTLTSNTDSTNIVVTVAPGETTVPGDIVYFVSSTGGGQIQWGAVTNSVNAPAGIYIGQKDKPLLVEINSNQGMKGSHLGLVSGDYVR